MNGWVIGYIVGAGVVVIVAVLLIMLIAAARQTAVTAESILSELIRARDGTRALWAVQQTNAAAERIVAGARAARESVEGA